MAVIDIMTLIRSPEFKGILLREQLPVTLNTEMHMEVILCSFISQISGSSKISERSPGQKIPPNNLVSFNLEEAELPNGGFFQAASSLGASCKVGPEAVLRCLTPC